MRDPSDYSPDRRGHAESPRRGAPWRARYLPKTPTSNLQPPTSPRGHVDAPCCAPGAEMKTILLNAIRFYQRRLSPGLGPACRFQPTCSEYAAEAIEAHGALRGLPMAAWRLLRCNPLNDGGFDPVPDSRPAPRAEGSPRP